MPRQTRRTLTTVLFLDLVGSTTTASRLGDARWRELLTRFRRAVRAELRAHGGRERDTAGDGFLVTFAQPAEGVRSAAAIVSEAQRLGLDVRAGLHTGECEEIDGGLAGLAVHIGARVMAHAGPAEILTTQTVRDLVVGSGVGFEERGEHALKGVEGTWRVLAVSSLDGSSLPAPLAAGEAEALLETTAAGLREAGRRRRLVATAVAVMLAGVAAGAFLLVGRGGGTHAATAKTVPPALVRLDTRTRRLRTLLPGSRQTYLLRTVNGTLWQVAGAGTRAVLVSRNVRTGTAGRAIPLPSGWHGLDFGFGSVWILRASILTSGPEAGSPSVSVYRYDEVSGRRVATIRFAGDVTSGTIAVGNAAVWVLERDGTLVRIDPLANRPVARFRTGAVETTFLFPVDGYDWVCECLVNKVLRFDPRTGQAKTFSIPEQAQLVGVDTAHGHTLWLLDPDGATLTPMNPRTGETGQPLGLAGHPRAAVIANGAVWAAAGRVVNRVDLDTKTRTTIGMPPGFDATAIAADAPSGELWVGAGPP